MQQGLVTGVFYFLTAIAVGQDPSENLICASPSLSLSLSLLANACLVAGDGPLEGKAPLTGPRNLALETGRNSLNGPLSLDEAFLHIADSAPAFGGAFLTDLGLKVVVTDSAAFASTAEVLLRSIENADEWSDLMLLRGRTKLELEEGAYNWADLFWWRRSFDDRMPRGTLYTDIDEVENRIDVGVLDDDAIAAALEVGRDLGIPPDAFSVHLAKPILPTGRPTGPLIDSLKGYVRPTIAGIQLQLHFSTIVNGQPANAINECSLGANVTLIGSADPIFLTNSHCTKELFEQDGVTGSPTWYQPSSVVSGGFLPPIATSDRTDPGLFSGGSCLVGRVCRWSDAALVVYSAPLLWVGGFIAYPSLLAPDPFEFGLGIEIGPPNQSMPAGKSIFKVGIGAGFKVGQRGQTCMHVNLFVSSYPDPPPANTTLLCQYKTEQLANGGGDSGGPVFFWDGFLPAKAKFAGIHWGGVPLDLTTVYSPVSGIKTDLGTLRYNLQ